MSEKISKFYYATGHVVRFVWFLNCYCHARHRKHRTHTAIHTTDDWWDTDGQHDMLMGIPMTYMPNTSHHHQGNAGGRWNQQMVRIKSINVSLLISILGQLNMMWWFNDATWFTVKRIIMYSKRDDKWLGFLVEEWEGESAHDLTDCLIRGVF